ncbi:hypothetical protein O9992_20955 [Vibrio lentus]|nr:hypothetical protein [Vibrio lentus]
MMSEFDKHCSMAVNREILVDSDRSKGEPQRAYSVTPNNIPNYGS